MIFSDLFFFLFFLSSLRGEVLCTSRKGGCEQQLPSMGPRFSSASVKNTGTKFLEVTGVLGVAQSLPESSARFGLASAILARPHHF